MENRQQFKQLSVSSLQFLLTSGKAISSSVLIINNIVCSDRLPFCINIVTDINPIVVDVPYQPKIKWHAANTFDKQQYSVSTGKLSSVV